MVERIILVDSQDNPVGAEEKIAAHENGGKLHRAFSIFIFNSKGEMLLQQRAKSKYHCGGLWTNTCCSHPRVGEILEEAVRRRLPEEMGFTCPTKEIFAFEYKAGFPNGLTEWEYDHVFIGNYDGEIKPNPSEVEEYKWISVEDLQKDVKEHPEKYTPWFLKALEKVIAAL